MVALDENSGDTKVKGINPQGAMNICIKFHGNLSDSCCNIQVWIKVVERVTDRP